RLSWGEIVAGKARRLNLKALAEFAQHHCGGGMNRTSLAQVFDLDEPPADGAIAFRAWVLLTAINENPAEWGVDDSVVPPGYDIDSLREQLRNRNFLKGGRADPLSPGHAFEVQNWKILIRQQ